MSNPTHKNPLARTGKDIFNLVRAKQNGAETLKVPQPVGETQTALVAVWTDVLGTQNFSVDDDFFKVGGNSIKAVQLASRFVKAFSVQVELTDVFLNPTIAAQAILIKEKQQHLSTIPPLKAYDRPLNIPLSFSQERLWFINELEGSVQYHIPLLFELTGNINPHFLQQTFNVVINRHQVLRSVIVVRNGEPCQEVLEPGQWQLTKVEATNVPSPTHVQAYIQEQINAPFNLSADYMVRASIINTLPNQHLLLIVLHHIAADGWSMPLMVNEFTEVYASLLQQRQPVLPSLPVQYADYAIWQRSYLTNEVLESQLAWWKQKLSGLLPLDLPADYSRPARRSTKGAQSDFKIDTELTSQLNYLSQQQGSTLFMTLLAAFKVLLYKYTGQQDVCVGTPVANRSLAETHDMIGLFVNTIALRNQVDPANTFTQFLQQLIPNTLEAYRQQEVPFEKVVEATVTQRDPSRTPLVQVMFVYQNNPQTNVLQLGEVEILPQQLQTENTRFDLTLSVNENEDGLDCAIEFSTDLYATDRIKQMMGHYTELLANIVQLPDTAISQLSILSKRETAQLLFDFNNTQTSFPYFINLDEAFLKQVNLRPAAPALYFNDETLTYGQLNERACQVARLLQQKGVTNETPVPVCMERSLEMVISILGILKAGGAFVPVDPEYPDERIQFIMHDTGASIVLCTPATLIKLQVIKNIEACVIDINDPTLQSQSGTPLPIKILPNNLAYIIYTSGSTGRPKGVMIEQEGVINLAYSQAVALNLQAGTKTLQFASFGFDAFCYELFNTLLSGGQLIIPQKQDILSPVLFETFINRHGVQVAVLPPSFLQVITHCTLSLQTIVSAGEALSQVTCLQFEAKGIKIINAYGPTEITVCATLSHEPVKQNNVVTIGKPISNVKLRILDKDGGLCPIGISGELCVTGVQVARGYLNRPDLTTQKFVNDSYGQGRMYKTGDVGRWLPDGDIEYLGRIDDQVKVRGFRIEPGEVENYLLQHSAIKQATVIPKLINGQTVLVAYYVPAQTVDITHLKMFLRENLPAYMLPDFWVSLAELPLTLNGKIDKKALPPPGRDDATGATFKAPETLLQQQIAKLWQPLLDQENISIDADFFSLGGNSISAMRFVAALAQWLTA